MAYKHTSKGSAEAPFPSIANAEKTGLAYSIRAAEKGQVEELYSIFRKEGLNFAKEATGLSTLVAVDRDSGKVLGGIQYRIDDRGHSIDLSRLAVEGGLQERGLGRALVEDALRIAKESGCERATITPSGIPQIRIYAHFGFAPPSNQGEGPALKMSKKL